MYLYSILSIKAEIVYWKQMLALQFVTLKTVILLSQEPKLIFVSVSAHLYDQLFVANFNFHSADY